MNRSKLQRQAFLPIWSNTVAKIETSSRNIQSIDYDDETKVLTVDFRSGNTYMYHDVTEEEYEKLLSASTRTGYLNHNLSKTHKMTRLGGE